MKFNIVNSLRLAFFGMICAAPLQAAPLLLNFTPVGSPVTNVSPNLDAGISAGHATGAVSASDVSWNNLQTGDVASGLIWGDGTAATGVSVNLGVSAAGSDIIDFANNPTNVGLGTSLTAGIYSGSRVARYGIWGGGSTSSNIAVGVRIDGLAAGEYQIYVTGRNTANSGNLSAAFYASAGSGSLYDFSAVANIASVANTASATGSYLQNVNFGLLTVTLSEGQSLFVATQGTTTEQRGFLNSLEVVAVPEPSTGLLLAGGLTVVVVMRRRQGKN